MRTHGRRKLLIRIKAQSYFLNGFIHYIELLSHFRLTRLICIFSVAASIVLSSVVLTKVIHVRRTMCTLYIERNMYSEYCAIVSQDDCRRLELLLLLLLLYCTYLGNKPPIQHVICNLPEINLN